MSDEPWNFFAYTEHNFITLIHLSYVACVFIEIYEERRETCDNSTDIWHDILCIIDIVEFRNKEIW